MPRSVPLRARIEWSLTSRHRMAGVWTIDSTRVLLVLSI